MLFARRIAIALARRKELGEAMAVARTCGLAEPWASRPLGSQHSGRVWKNRPRGCGEHAGGRCGS
jgi:hypothetical protein